MQELNIWKSTLATIIYVVVLEVLGMMILLDLLFPEAESVDSILLISFSLYCLGSLSMLIVVYFSLRKYIFPKSENAIATKKIDLTYLILAIVFGFIIVFIQPFIRSAFAVFPGFELQVQSAQKLAKLEVWHIPTLFSSIIILPLSEELFFRGFILKGLLKKHNVFLALLISSLLFGAVHFAWYTMNIISLRLVFITFIGGLIAGGLFIKTNRLIYPILFHITWNLIVNISHFVAIPFL
ncbi:MAG: CPBP family intramembrane metalloprotease [Crocinitomix sp.]|nr:CPBP family intramembrane metalloprotease [Crocinitomix sp.]